ncbi:MAG: hypothetical protein ABL986_24545, partial [Vicinamibacterales bacterium]
PPPSAVGQLKAITFEAGSLVNATNGLDAVRGVASLETAAPLKGWFSARVAGEVYLEEKFSASDDLYVSLYIRIGALPVADTRIVQISNAGDTVGNIVLRTNGRLRLRIDGKTVGAESQSLVPGQLYRIGIHQRSGTGADAVLEAFVASASTPFGAAFSSATTGVWTTRADRLRLGATTSSVVDLVVDDVVLNTGSMPGASQ